MGVVVVTVAVSIGLTVFGLAGLAAPGKIVPGGDAGAAHVFAAYMAARNLPFAAALLVALMRRARHALAVLLAVQAAIQAFDAVLGVLGGQVAQIIAPAVLAVALAASARWLANRGRARARGGAVGLTLGAAA